MCTLMNIWPAICWLVNPWATSSDTVHSVPVRLGQPVDGLVWTAQCRRRTPSLRSRRRRLVQTTSERRPGVPIRSAAGKG